MSPSHPTASATFAGLLPRVLADDPSVPRLTCYDDLPGPTCGERVELSARVLEKWVAKAASALEERDAGPGAFVRIAAQPHWRCVYWALAAWSTGAAVALDQAPAEVVVGDDVETVLAAADAGAAGVLLTRASLARSAGVELPWDVLDDARELATFPDAYVPAQLPAGGDPALRLSDGRVLEHGSADLVRDLPAGARLAATPGDAAALLLALRSAWSAGGSLVVAVGRAVPTPPDGSVAGDGAAPDDGLVGRWRTESVTATW